MINVSIIGLGYWGPNYLRIFNELPQSKVRYCCDLDTNNLNKMKKENPNVKITQDYKKVAQDSYTDAIIIATPLNTHYTITKCCLEHKKHMLVEKPFTSNYLEGKKLIKLAEKNSLVLMVGHVYKYNPGIKKLKELMESGKLGDVYYIREERIGLGPIRKYASALWDLATHDISIALYLTDSFPTEIAAQGESYLQKNIEDLVFLTLKFPKNIMCTIYATWIAPEKIRKITIVGSKAMAIFDDINKQKMIQVYERELDAKLINSTPKYSDHQNIINIGKIYIPEVDKSEPLKNQAQHFLECILEHKQPITSGEDGINVVKVLNLAEKSLKD